MTSINGQSFDVPDREYLLEENKILRERLEAIPRHIPEGFIDWSAWVGKLAAQVNKVEEESYRFRKALEFYAKIENYQKDGLVDVGGHLEDFRPILGDYGGLARHTLAEKEGL